MIPIYEPGRLAYHKKFVMRSGTSQKCAFCDTKKMKAQTCASFSFQYWTIVANLRPYMNGNLMIVPRRHVEDVDELTDEEQAEWFEAVREVKKTLRALFKTTSFNLSLNLGEFSGRSIRHLHWQIIPRIGRHQINAINIFTDIYAVSVSARELVNMIDSYRTKQKKKTHR